MTKAKHEETAAELVGEKKQDASVKADAAEELAREAVKEEARLDTGTKAPDPEEPTAAEKYQGHSEIMQWAYMLDLGIEAFEDAIDKKAERPVPEEKVYGLLALERNGQNRTLFVKAMMKRLGLKSDELPGGGPDYTVDTTPVSKL